jgi:hypothetical protein
VDQYFHEVFLPVNYRIPIEDAARRAYEAAERVGSLDSVVGTAPEERLNHFKFAFMLDDRITLYGVKEPSRRSRPIPRGELRDLPPVAGKSQLNYRWPYDRVAYTNVRISRAAVRKAIRRYLSKIGSPHRSAERPDAC